MATEAVGTGRSARRSAVPAESGRASTKTGLGVARVESPSVPEKPSERTISDFVAFDLADPAPRRPSARHLFLKGLVNSVPVSDSPVFFSAPAWGRFGGDQLLCRDLENLEAP